MQDSSSQCSDVMNTARYLSLYTSGIHHSDFLEMHVRMLPRIAATESFVHNTAEVHYLSLFLDCLLCALQASNQWGQGY